MVALARELRVRGKAMASIKTEARKMIAQGKERCECPRTPEWGSHDIPNRDNSCTLRADVTLSPTSALLFAPPLSHPLAAVPSPHPSPLAQPSLASRQATNHSLTNLTPCPRLSQATLQLMVASCNILHRGSYRKLERFYCFYITNTPLLPLRQLLLG